MGGQSATCHQPDPQRDCRELEPIGCERAVAGKTSKDFVTIQGETAGSERRVDLEKAQLEVAPAVTNPTVALTRPRFRPAARQLQPTPKHG